jgi:hypothetical protein
VVGGGIDLLDDRDAKGGGLAGAGLRLTDEVGTRAQRRNGTRLHLGRSGVTHPLERARDRHRNLDVAEAVAAGLGQGRRDERRIPRWRRGRGGRRG